MDDKVFTYIPIRKRDVRIIERYCKKNNFYNTFEEEKIPDYPKVISYLMNVLEQEMN